MGSLWFDILCMLLLLLPTSCTRAGNASQAGKYSAILGAVDVNATYDYVIVGGGTSGLAVAKRLAEDPAITVAVVEAGGFYELESGNNLNGREVFYAQGKTVGGGSARNVLAYHRGTRESYQRWADTVQDQSFTFDRLLPYFRKSPIFTPSNDSTNQYGSSVSNETEFFGATGGPLHVSYSHYRQPFTPFIQSAMEKLGLKRIGSFNSGALLGFAPLTSTIAPATETRSSSETSFLQAAVDQKQHVILYHHTNARRILFSPNKTATGVLVSTGSGSYTLTARKEVIIAAGVYKSPQILMVSGIGPPATLRRLQIPIVSALNGVGQNLWVCLNWLIALRKLKNNASYLYRSDADFQERQTGPLTNTGVNIIGWEKVPNKYRELLSRSSIRDLAQFPPDWPELELLPIAAATFPVTDKANYASFTIAIVAPLSRGNVSIRSTNITEPPLINPNWLSSKTDQEVAIAGVKVARELALNSGITMGPEVVPGPMIQTDEQILGYLKETAHTIHHAAATCAMGAQSNPMAVVSTTGKVYGVKSLRVVDASTFPILPPGHSQATVCEKTALANWLQRVSFISSSNEQPKTVKARKEVILAAGVFQTPQLLELSGIGDSELLRQLGIEVVLDNKNVGENLQDHAMTGLCAEVKEDIPTGDLRRDPPFKAKAMEMYEKDRTGPLTAGFPSFAFLPLADWADDSDIEARDREGTSYGDVFAVTEPENYAAILVSLPHPFSAGTVHIESKDPTRLPVVDPRFMSHPLDVEVLGRHVKALDQLLAAEPFASLLKAGGRRLPATSPLFTPEALGDESKRLDAAREHARTYIRSTSHPVGTCSMLPLEKGGVVDSRLRVYGVRGLRVVDASVFPMVPRGNIQSTVYTVAERAADFVKDEWSIVER
ncbi:MAG: hypothetical protein Q9166_001981 [cf. Caloplaca sp. 2 TL-2023]